MLQRPKVVTTPTQRVLLALCGILVVVTTVGAGFLASKSAYAQIVPAPVTTVEVGPAAQTEVSISIWERAQMVLRWAMEHGAAIAFKNALRTFTQRIAYDTAVMIASGGQGQTPLLSWTSLGQSAERGFDDAAGDFLDTLDNENGFIRLGLCRPVGFDFRLIVTSALFQEIQPRRPRCTLSDIEQNIERYRQNPEQFLDRVGVVFDPKQNELGVALHLQQTLIQDAATQKQLAVLEQGFNQGFKDITEDITGFIKTPASRVRTQAETAQSVASEDFSTYTGDILADALGVFTNTLAARLMKRLLQGDIPNPSRLESRRFGLAEQSTVDYAVEVNSTIATPQLVGGQDVDVISEYSNCPQDVRFASVNNCTITERFAAALRKADEGQPMTVQEAISEGFINGQLRFALVRTSDDTRSPSKYWYLSDIKKMRKARIVPLGWELAAQAFAGTSVTLQQVIGTKPNYDDGFNGKGADGLCGTSDDASPYCGMIDPSWILKAPAQQCRAVAYGQLLESESHTRQQTCVDVQQCVAERSDGSCLAWGYCTQEKNIWRLSGESCEFPQGSGYSPYGTCQTFTSRTSKTASYLQSSLTNFDDGVCSAAVGCKWYSASLNNSSSTGADRYRASGTPSDVNTVSFTPAAATAPKLYLKEAERYRCTSKEEGCTEFLRLSNVDGTALGIPGGTQAQLVTEAVTRVSAPASTDTYEQYAQVQSFTMKEAPTYLNCYDTDPANDAPECRSYALLCSADEVGCELYTPTDGSPAVPGVATTDNTCPQACIGLNEYQQQPSFFEPTPTPATHRFIPSTALQCSAQYAGCEEFTNVEQNERREYYVELRQCIRPGEGDATYYTWVGSDLTGYQLKTWQLEGGANQPPVTTAGSGDCRVGGVYPASDPDCKEFYDANGNPHYRLFTKTRSASEQCNRYRRTGTVDTDFTADDCTSNGGNVEGSFCFYRAIPSQGKVCGPQFVGCREFRGPTASNVRLAFPVSTFGDREPGVNADSSPLSGWTGGTNSNESTSAFGHSLSVSGTAVKEIRNQVQNGRQYLLTFWALGTSSGQQFSAAIEDRAIDISFGQTTAASTADTWQVYQLGPVILTGLEVETARLMVWGSGGSFYLDNVQLREVQDSFFVRKDSWNTPSECDTNLHLRCSAYRTRSGSQVALTGFSRICRNEAAGCEALVNTQNSSVPRAQTFTVGGQTVDVSPDQVAYRVYDGKKVCSAVYAGCRRVGEPVTDNQGAITQWSDVFMRLDPDTFDPVSPISPLCDVQQNKCEQYTDPSGATHYFKEPGERVCEYKLVDTQLGYNWYKRGTTERCNLVENPSFETFTGTTGDGAADTFVGWSSVGGSTLQAALSLNGTYWESVVLNLQSGDALTTGVASTANVIEAAGGPGSSRLFVLYVRAYAPVSAALDVDWALGVTCSGGCSQIPGTVDRLDRAAARDRWHLLTYLVRTDASTSSLALTFTTNGAVAQNDQVYVDQAQAVTLDPTLTDNEALALAEVPYAYLCPSDQAGCTAFQDPELTKETYYYLNNERLDREACSGRVSEKEGCLLFNNLSSVSLAFNAPLTYADSLANNNLLVAPSTDSPQDTNVVLKVQRDRTCGEWLACQSESPRFNPQTNQFDSICYSLGRCNSLAGTVAGSSARCGNWLTRADAPAVQNIAWYQQQPRNWDDPEYSGYTVPNIYPLDVLSQNDYSADPQSPDYRLTHLDRSTGQDLGLGGAGPGTDLENTGSRLCRAYPQADAPFPAEIASTWASPCQGGACPTAGSPAYLELPDRLESGFSQANTCQRDPVTGRLENCECTYQRVTYTGGEQLFYSVTSSQVKSRFAVDVDFNDKPLMSRLRKRELAFGQRGYCIEKDTSRVINAGAARDYACLTWYPTDVVSGEISVYDYAPEAGYQGGATYYCSQAAGNISGRLGVIGVQTLSNYVVQSSMHGHVMNYYVNPTPEPVGLPNDLNWCDRGDPDCEKNTQINACLSSSGVCGHVVDNGDFYLSIGDDERAAGGLEGIEGVEVVIHMGTIQISTGSMYFDRTNSSGFICLASCDNAPNGLQVDLDWNDPNNFYHFAVFHQQSGEDFYIISLNYRLREICTETVRVAGVVTNKAWTDRVLRRNDYQVQASSGLGFTVSRQQSPYGKLPLSTDPSNELMLVSDIAGTASLADTDATLITTPFACSGNCGSSSTPGMCIVGTANKLFKPCKSSSECGNSTTPGVCQGYFSGSCSGGTRNGQDCISNSQCPGGGVCQTYRTLNAATDPSGRLSIDDLFASEYNRWTYGTTWTEGGPGNDVSGTVGLAPGVPVAPEIRQVLLDASGKATGEGATGFTVLANGTSYQNGSITVNSGDAVSALFYAYNLNGEQMPLNRVLVDWEGNTASFSGAQGKYKNRKHDCRALSDPNYNWGDDPRACVEDTDVSEGYFTYTHIYTCPPGQTCTYTPRVYVQDNWEWCFGSGGALWKEQCNINQAGAWLPFSGSVTVSD